MADLGLAPKQTVGIPALLLLTYIMLTKGASLGVKALYVVVATLGISLLAFFLGETDYAKQNSFDPLATIYNTETEQDSLTVDLTPEAFFKDIQISFQYYSNIHKMAIAGRSKWLEGLAKIGDFLSPGIKVKFFMLDEKQEAMDWLK